MIAKASSISAAAAAVLLALPHYGATSPTKRQSGPFQPTWESTDQHNPSPEWFKDAKFGIYWHWGVFTVPEYGFEWYPRHMYDANDNMGRHHRSTYGDPSVQGGFGYQNFTFGSPDVAGNVAQFKPVRSSEGGEWDPEHWIEVIKASGAKFAGPVAEHHDGYALWDSKFNEWNSAKLGPKLDIVRIFEKLVRDNGMKFMIAMHQAYNTNGFFGFAPQQSDPSLRRLLGQFNHEEGSERWLAKQLEAMDHVRPDMIWNDFGLYSPGFCHGSSDICAIREKERLEFLATYFNRGVEWSQEVLTTYKHFDQGFRDTSAVADWERGGPADLTRPYWLTDEAISASSWSYTKGISYYSQKSMIHSLLDRVAKNGNMLLNISPTAAGVLPAEQETILRGIGAWLQRNGEAIYGTRAWDVYGEGPNRAGGGSFTKPLEGDSRDIRFTRNKEENVLYASVLGWPANGEVKIIHFGSEARVSMAGLKSIDLIGGASGLQYKHNRFDLAVTLPQKPFESDAYVLKLTFAQRIPVPQPPRGVTIWPTKDITDTTKGVTLPEGDFRGIFLEDAGLKGGDVTYMRVSGFTKVTVWKAGNLQGEWKDYFEGDHTFAPGTVGSMRIVGI